MNKYLTFNNVVQVAVVFFTILGFLLTSFKLPEWGLISNLASQPFWIYSAYKSWKNADQIGTFINTLIITLILIWGIVNYWFL